MVAKFCCFASGILTEEDIDEVEVEDGRKWSDRDLMETFGTVTALEVEEEKDGNNVQRIRARSPLSTLSTLPQVRHREAWSMVTVERDIRRDRRRPGG